MNKFKITTLILALLILLIGCKDEFLLEPNNYEPIMVVDGMITNESGPYIIKLSFASPVNYIENAPLEGCTVSLYENTDKSEVLTETEPGIYVTSEGGIQGTAGNNYSISIITPEGKEYYTESQEMKEPVGIDSVYAEISSINHEISTDGLPGFQFYIDTETGTDKENYFLWKSTETYEHITDFVLFDIIFGELRLDTNDLIRDTLVQNYQRKFFRCWSTQPVNYIFTGKTNNLSIPKIARKPLQFVGTNSKRLLIRYSLNIEQLTVNKDAYYYWQNIEKQSTNDNFLIATQPYNIIGNIKNKNNPDELIFGNVTVASIVTKRIFVDRPNAPFYYDKCSLITDSGVILAMFEYGDPPPPWYLIKYDNSCGFGVLIFESCVNCTLNGGSNLKPDFWIDK